MKIINLQIQESQQASSRRNTKTTTRHIIIKLLKTDDKKHPEKKTYIMHTGINIRMTADFMSEIMQARR